MINCRIERDGLDQPPRHPGRPGGLQRLVLWAAGLSAACVLGLQPLAAQQPPPSQNAEPEHSTAGSERAGQAPSLTASSPSPLAPARPILLSPLVRPNEISLPPVAESAAAKQEASKEEADVPGDSAAPPSSSTVASEGLGQPDPAAIGLSFEAGLSAPPQELWSGLSRARLAALITAVDLAALPAPLVALGRRLLLTAAPPPPPKAGENPLALLRARFAVLARAGLSHEIVALGALRDPALKDGDILHVLVQAQLVEGAFADGCALARAADARSHDRRWLPILLFCAAHEADRARLDLTLGLYNEVFGEDALAILALRLADLRESGSSTISPPEPDSYAHASDPVVTAIAAMLVGESPPVAFVTRASGLILAALLRHDRLEPDARIIIARKGYEAHLLDAATLAQILVAYPFPPGSRQGLIEGPPPPPSAPMQLRELTAARRMAAVVQWLAEASEGEELMRRVGELGSRLTADEFLNLAPLVALPLSALSPQLGDGDRLSAILDVLIASDRLATARQWWNAALSSSSAPTEMTTGMQRGDPALGIGMADQTPTRDCPADSNVTLRGLVFLLAPLADTETDGKKKLMGCVASALGALPAAWLAERADAAAILLGALGRREAASHFEALALQALSARADDSGPPRFVRPAPASLWALMSEAVTQRHVGKGLLAAILLGERGDGLAARSAVIAALASLGFADAAERMAVREWLHRLRWTGKAAVSSSPGEP